MGPTVRDGAIVTGPVSAVSGLPVGWTDKQERASYRLHPRADDVVFGFAAGAQSAKPVLFPAKELLWRSRRRNGEAPEIDTTWRPMASRRWRYWVCVHATSPPSASTTRFSCAAPPPTCTTPPAAARRSSLPWPAPTLSAPVSASRWAPFFASLDPDIIAPFAGCAKNVHFRAGEVLFNEGSAADTFYLIRTGRVSVMVHQAGVGGMVIDTVEAGGVVGWSWLVAPYRWTFDARVVKDTSAVAFDATCLRTKCDDDPAVGYAQVAGVLLARLGAARIRLLDLYGVAAS